MHLSEKIPLLTAQTSQFSPTEALIEILVGLTTSFSPLMSPLPIFITELPRSMLSSPLAIGEVYLALISLCCVMWYELRTAELSRGFLIEPSMPFRSSSTKDETLTIWCFWLIKSGSWSLFKLIWLPCFPTEFLSIERFYESNDVRDPFWFRRLMGEFILGYARREFCLTWKVAIWSRCSCLGLRGILGGRAEARTLLR